MPTYNYRLTGRDISMLSAVESTDRVLLWGADAIHCGHPGCRFEICAVGRENVMGGAMQEGWGFSQAAVDKLTAIPEGCIGVATTVEEMRQPWRCALHLTPDHKPMTPEMITEHCPGPPSPEYQRGHADGFEAGSRSQSAQRPIRGFVGQPRNLLDIPTVDEIASTLRDHGGMAGIAPMLNHCLISFMSGERAKTLMEEVSAGMGVPAMIAQSLFAIAIMCSALYFNDKYGEQIETANNIQ